MTEEDELLRSHPELETVNKELLAVRTSLAWYGMMASAWRHSIEVDAINIYNCLTLLRRYLGMEGTEGKFNKRLDRIDQQAERILEKPITSPLSEEEGVQSIALNNLLHQHTLQLWQNEPYKSVSLELSLALDDYVTIWANPQWLRRALEILINNAVEATIDLSKPRIILASRLVAEVAEISISDNGKGILPEILPNLFHEPIKEVDGSTGHGIGLLLAQTIFQTYGGTIRLDNTGPNGTTFTIALPVEN